MRLTSPGRGFVLLYALAYAGLFVSFMPFVTLLLPLKVAEVAGEHRVTLLSAAALGGAAVASVANIIFGTLSDRTHRLHGTRRPWIAGGLMVLILGYAALHFSHDATTLLLSVAVLQVAINMMFAPVGAIMADEVPDRYKGLVAGVLGAAQPIATLIAVLLARPEVGSEANRYALLCAIIAAMLLPFLTLAREANAAGAEPPPTALRTQRRADFARIWFGRVLMQIAGNGLATYGFFYFLHVLHLPAATGKWEHDPSGVITTVVAISTITATLLTVLAGRASDAIMRRKPFVAAATVAMTGGLATMALAQTLGGAALGYGAAMVGLSVFLAMQSALAMQLLPSPEHRGRDLGILNLTNTLPAMVAPLIALALDPEHAGFAALWLTLALGALAGGAVVLSVRGQA